MKSQYCSSRVDREILERNKRNQMKFLYSKLNSLISNQNSKEATSLSDQLDEAANYIKLLEKRLEELKEKKEILLEAEKLSTVMNNGMVVAMRSLQIEIHEMGSALKVILITGLDCHFMFNKIIHVLHEEGAEVVNASFSVVGDTVFHTIYSQVGDSTCGFGAAGISQRLKKLCP